MRRASRSTQTIRNAFTSTIFPPFYFSFVFYSRIFPYWMVYISTICVLKYFCIFNWIFFFSLHHNIFWFQWISIFLNKKKIFQSHTHYHGIAWLVTVLCVVALKIIFHVWYQIAYWKRENTIRYEIISYGNVWREQEQDEEQISSSSKKQKQLKEKNGFLGEKWKHRVVKLCTRAFNKRSVWHKERENMADYLYKLFFHLKSSVW